MKATLRHIYLCRTANMSWRTCVVVIQIKSNQSSVTKTPSPHLLPTSLMLQKTASQGRPQSPKSVTLGLMKSAVKFWRPGEPLTEKSTGRGPRVKTLMSFRRTQAQARWLLTQKKREWWTQCVKTQLLLRMCGTDWGKYLVNMSAH